MKTALIGFTGFVGSNLANQYNFDDYYNSKNISDIAKQEYDLVVSAGARAEKWRINQEPQKDLAEINSLVAKLKTTKAGQLVLISTVDVYKIPIGIDEDTPPVIDGLHAYGANRIYLENFVRDNFNSLIIRLPGLFGPGLKKNVIYDFLHNNNVDKIHHAGSFQYYNLTNIWRDISIAREAGLDLVNFATEPVRTDEVAEHCFGIDDFVNEPQGVTAGSYDMHTKHASLYGKESYYIYDKSEILQGIKQFVEAERQAT